VSEEARKFNINIPLSFSNVSMDLKFFIEHRNLSCGGTS
jgi:hypothetical protein